MAEAERAFLAEMHYYAGHCHEGSDAAALAGLRARCAAIVLEELGIDADPAVAAVLLRDAIAFRAFDDAAPLLAGLRSAGVAVAVVSNWDCSLRDALEGVGIEIDVVVDSASAGSSKPDPGIFRRAVAALGVSPGRVLHVGDTEATDGAGARAAGIDVRILDRGASSPGAGYHHRAPRRPRLAVTTPPRRTAATTAIHAGRQPALPGVPVISPVHRSVIHEFADADEFARVMGDSSLGYLYGADPKRVDRRAGGRGRRARGGARRPLLRLRHGGAERGRRRARAARRRARCRHPASTARRTGWPRPGPTAGWSTWRTRTCFGRRVAGAALRPLRDRVQPEPRPSPTSRRWPRSRTPRARGSWSTTRSPPRSTAGRSITAPTSSSTRPPST